MKITAIISRLQKADCGLPRTEFLTSTSAGHEWSPLRSDAEHFEYDHAVVMARRYDAWPRVLGANEVKQTVVKQLQLL